jgi:hypothetical protein
MYLWTYNQSKNLINIAHEINQRKILLQVGALIHLSLL